METVAGSGMLGTYEVRGGSARAGSTPSTRGEEPAGRARELASGVGGDIEGAAGTGGDAVRPGNGSAPFDKGVERKL